MKTKFKVIVYEEAETIDCDSEFEAEQEMETQSRLYGRICRMQIEENDDDDD